MTDTSKSLSLFHAKACSQHPISCTIKNSDIIATTDYPIEFTPAKSSAGGTLVHCQSPFIQTLSRHIPKEGARLYFHQKNEPKKSQTPLLAAYTNTPQRILLTLIVII